MNSELALDKIKHSFSLVISNLLKTTCSHLNSAPLHCPVHGEVIVLTDIVSLFLTLYTVARLKMAESIFKTHSGLALDV